jgi:hypothetical protein
VPQIQVDKLKRRRDAAKSALRYFSDIKSIKSTNNPFAFTGRQDQANLDAYRDDTGGSRDTIAQSFEDASHFKIGNCDEKGRIVYSSLIGNPVIAKDDAKVSLVSSIGYDHVFCIIADEAVVAPTSLNNFNDYMMIVDGWTEDWYFPNLSWTTAKWYGLANVPNPRQLVVRTRIKRHQFEGYGYDSENEEQRMPSLTGMGVISRKGMSNRAFGAI